MGFVETTLLIAGAWIGAAWIAAGTIAWLSVRERRRRSEQRRVVRRVAPSVPHRTRRRPQRNGVPR